MSKQITAKEAVKIERAHCQEQIKRCNLKWTLILIASMFLAIAVTTFTCWSYSQIVSSSKIKVGVLMAFTGSSASTGQGAVMGVQLAMHQLGANNIELIQEDSQCDPKVAPDAMRRLIEQGVIAVIGDSCSSSTMEVLSEANSNKVPLISPSASSPRLSIANDYFFRVVPSDNYQGSYLAAKVHEMGYEKVAVFFTNETYGSAIAQIFNQEFTRRGGIVETTEYCDGSAIDIENQSQKIINSHPEAVMIFSNAANTSSSLMQSLRDKGYTGQYFGGDALYEEAVIQNTKDHADGLIVSVFSTGDNDFRQVLVDNYSIAEFPYGAPQGYDAFQALQIAFQKGARSGQEIFDMLPQIQFSGVSGEIQFDHFGDLLGDQYDYSLLQVSDGQFGAIEQ